MKSRTANRFVRILRLAPIVAFVFGGCTCSGSPSSQPPPTATATTRPASTPTPVARATAVLPSPVATVETPSAPQESPPDAAAAEKRAACEGYVAVLSGRKADPALLDNPEVRALGMQSPDLVTCGAVLSDSDTLCKRLMPMEHGPGTMCSHMRSIFNELRAYPNGRSFMFDEVDWQERRSVPALTTFFDSLREALRSGDPKECAQTGDGESMCRAYMTLDKSLCVVSGKLAELEIEPPVRKEGEPAKLKIKGALEDGCRQTIESRAFLAQGLKVLAESGPPRERELAKAALHQADACETYAQAATQFCARSGATPVPGTAVPAPPAAGTPGPGAPNSTEAVSRTGGEAPQGREPAGHPSS